MSKLKQKLANDEVYFIAEMSANHGNDLELALSIVDAAAEAGADCLKVQTYTADSMTLDCKSDLFRIEGGLWDGRYLYELYEEASFPWDWHQLVKERCDDLGIDFLSTPFDETSVDFLDTLGVDAFKIASFELTDIPLLKYVASQGKPMIISTGMGTKDEIQEAVDTVRKSGCEDVILLKCCSEYPADSADMNLSTIKDMSDDFGCTVGFSDHSMGYLMDVIAAVNGARVIEKHFCISREIETPDSAFSMMPLEYGEMVAMVNAAMEAMGKPTYGPSASEKDSLVFRRSIFASQDIAQGEAFTPDNIRVIRPSYGAHPRNYQKMLGTVSDRDYRFGDPIVFGE